MATRQPIDLAELKAKIHDDKAQPIVAGDRTFYVLPPELMSDEKYQQLQTLDDDDVIGQARLMIDDYDGFVAAGGSAMLLAMVLDQMAEAPGDEGTTPGEGGASSSS